MRMRYKLLTALGLALLAVSGAVADTTPAPAPAAAYPNGYMNPFDPNWWLLTFNNMMRLYTVPVGTAAPAPASAPAAGAATTTAYPYAYMNPFDPNWWLTMAPTAAGPTTTSAPTMDSPYVATQTPYGTIYTFNYADPTAWNKMFTQPFAMPGQGAAPK